MSGHSKWSTIKHKKAATDKKRAVVFSKLARAIMVAAKEGGADPDGNAALANAIAKAKSYSLPKDNIERAIAKGAGGGEGENYEVVTYEGFGPGGAAFVVEALTDNRNRTAANVRSIFTKAGSALGVFGSATKAVEAKSPVASPTAAAGAKGGKRERKLGSLLGRNKNKAAPVPAEDQEEKEVLSAKQLDDKFFAAV